MQRRLGAGAGRPGGARSRRPLRGQSGTVWRFRAARGGTGVMRIDIVGGGPAGLYLAMLLKRDDPTHRVRVIEQDPADSTYGWGVVLSGGAVRFLREADPDSCADIARSFETWDDLVVVHRGQRVRVD